MRPGAGSELGKTPRKSIEFETIATCRVGVRQFSNHLATEQGGFKAALLFFVLQFRDVGFAALELYAEAVPHVP
jgi:hypothetical protein